jgi:hypothetical protein
LSAVLDMQLLYCSSSVQILERNTLIKHQRWHPFMRFVTTLNADLGFISTLPRVSLFFRYTTGWHWSWRIPDYVALYTVKWMQKHITAKEVSFIQMLLHEIRFVKSPQKSSPQKPKSYSNTPFTQQDHWLLIQTHNPSLFTHN